MLCLIFVPFYSLYWWYTRGEKVKQEFSQHNYASTGNGIVYLIFAIFGLSIVSMAIMQSDFNSLKSGTHSEQRSATNILYLQKVGNKILCNENPELIDIENHLNVVSGKTKCEKKFINQGLL